MRILLADNEPKVLFAIRVLLERRPEVVIVGEASDGQELLDQLKNDGPDMVILDWQLPGLAEMGSVSRLREARPGLFVIALSGRPELASEALEAGANDFVSKIDPPDRLLAKIAEYQKKIDGHYVEANSEQ